MVTQIYQSIKRVGLAREDELERGFAAKLEVERPSLIVDVLARWTIFGS
jgi:hypothetical protein